MNPANRTHPGLSPHKLRLNAPDADGYDSFGDPWWFCREHQQWFSDYCQGCHPTLHRIVVILSGIVAAAIIAGVIAGCVWIITSAPHG